MAFLVKDNYSLRPPNTCYIAKQPIKNDYTIFICDRDCEVLTQQEGDPGDVEEPGELGVVAGDEGDRLARPAAPVLGSVSSPMPRTLPSLSAG